MIKNKTLILDNGIRLVLTENKNKNQSYAEIIVNYGSLNQKFAIGKNTYTIPEGTAHLLEHSIVESNIYGNMFEHLKDEFVAFNAYTSGNETRFFVSTVYDFETHLEELIKIVNMPVFKDEALKKIKLPIYEEIKQGKDRRNKKYMDELNRCTFKNFVFPSTLGTVENVRKINAEFLKLVHSTFYQPCNQTIFLAGNFDTKNIIKLIEETYKSIESEPVNYQCLEKKESIKVNHRKSKIIDPNGEELITMTFKIDVSKLTPKERVKGTFYFSHFLDYNFNDSSKIYNEFYEKNETIYSIDYSLTTKFDDMYIIDIGLYGKNHRKFKKWVLDIMKHQYYDEEMFYLWKKQTTIDLIIRTGLVMPTGRAFLDNVMKHGYDYPDEVGDIEEFSLDDYRAFLKKLNFKNYTIVRSVKK